MYFYFDTCTLSSSFLVEHRDATVVLHLTIFLCCFSCHIPGLSNTFQHSSPAMQWSPLFSMTFCFPVQCLFNLVILYWGFLHIWLMHWLVLFFSTWRAVVSCTVAAYFLSLLTNKLCRCTLGTFLG